MIDGQDENGLTEFQRRWMTYASDADRDIEVRGFIGVNEGAPAFRAELEQLLNNHSRENSSNTPDFILADYMWACLDAFDAAVLRRDRWYGVAHRPGATADTYTE